MKRILAITGIRSDYDLMSPLYRLIQNDPEMELKLLVSGAHMSQSFGYSVENIREDGFDILLSIESLIDSNSSQSRLKSASVALQNSIDCVAQYRPDLILYAGDREDVIIGALLGGYMEIPTIHFYGGDHVKDSHIDNPIRHATSKLSTVHFVTLKEHKMRLIKMGEVKERIFVTGSIALDRFSNFCPMDKQEIRQKLNIKEGFEKFALMIFHPIVEEKKVASKYFDNILQALAKKNVNCFVSYPNVDPGSRDVISHISKMENDRRFKFYKNLPRDLFLSIYKQSDFIIGNSSSGIMEASSIPIPAINVGLRQIGRTAASNVIYCSSKQNELEVAIEKAKSPEFRRSIQQIQNPYGSGDSAFKAFSLIKNRDFSNMIYKNEDPLEQ